LRKGREQLRGGRSSPTGKDRCGKHDIRIAGHMSIIKKKPISEKNKRTARKKRCLFKRRRCEYENHA